MAKAESKKIKITLVQSVAGRDERTKRTLKSLGLKRISSSRIFPANPAILGVVNKLGYMFKVEAA